MRGIILIIGFFIGMASAFAEPEEQLVGRYTNAAYDGHYSYGWVEIRQAESQVESLAESQAGLELVFNVPCGSKLSPRVFKINQTSPISADLELIEEGGGQCYTGQNPRIMIQGNELHIYTNLRVRTPGFDGTYKLTK